jgi:protein-S-isoprenylcysteine O-methyltransferase Ste14
MIGFLLQWPTIPTLAMFQILLVIYTRLARAEEGEVAARFGESWRAYAAGTPGFIPHRRLPTNQHPPGQVEPIHTGESRTR